MSDLKSWNVITIQGELDADTFNELPDFGLHDGDTWDITTNQNEYTMSGWDSASPDRIADWAKHFTRIRPGTTVTWYEEFRMDDVGEDHLVFREGDLVRAESKTSALVPVELGELLTQAKAAIEKHTDGKDPRGTAVKAALQALVAGLQ